MLLYHKYLWIRTGLIKYHVFVLCFVAIDHYDVDDVYDQWCVVIADDVSFISDVNLRRM